MMHAPSVTFSYVCLTIALCTGCEANPTPDPALQLCNDPRPEICTQEYNPVCANLKDDSTKTYPTGCTACSDPGVIGWQPGACS